MTWTALPAGEPLALLPGRAYAIVASVKATHTAADLEAVARGRGLTLVDYAEEGERPGLGPDPRGPAYRYVAAIATAAAAGALPWAVPFPVSLLDSSHLVDAWTALATDLPPAGAAPTLPPPPAPSPAGELAGPWPWIGLAAAAGLAARAWWKGRRRG